MLNGTMLNGCVEWYHVPSVLKVCGTCYTCAHSKRNSIKFCVVIKLDEAISFTGLTANPAIAIVSDTNAEV